MSAIRSASSASLAVLVHSSALLLQACGGSVAIADQDQDGAAAEVDAGEDRAETVGDGDTPDNPSTDGPGDARIDVPPEADEPVDSCSDGVLDGDETGIDCGGSKCHGCEPGEACLHGLDCQSWVCEASVCQPPACDDMIVNGSESDVDCGGDCPLKCNLCERCVDSADCAEGACVGDRCTPTLQAPVAAGSEHLCAIRTGAKVWCWGRNWCGELGLGYTSAMVTTPTQVGAAGDNVAIDSKALHTCVIKSGGAVWCWGLNEYGQVTPQGVQDELLPVQVAGVADAVQLAVARNHTCVLTSGGQIVCWGENYFGGVGNGGPYDSKQGPAQVALPAGNYTHVASGEDHTCALRDDGTVWCWGRNDLGQVGDGTAGANHYVPVAVAGLPVAAVQVSLAGDHSCAVLQDSSAWCWGSDENGELGDGLSGSYSASPRRVAGFDEDIALVSAGGFHTCAVRTDGQTWCWGRNEAGQTGDGTASEPRLHPVRALVNFTPDVLVSGSMFTCAQSASELWCWGDNGSYEQTTAQQLPWAPPGPLSLPACAP